MHTQNSNQLENVATRLRGRVARDWLVGALFAVGMIFNVAVVGSAAKVAMGPGTSPSAYAEQQNAADADAGLVAVTRDAASERVAAVQ